LSIPAGEQSFNSAVLSINSVHFQSSAFNFPIKSDDSGRIFTFGKRKINLIGGNLHSPRNGKIDKVFAGANSFVQFTKRQKESKLVEPISNDRKVVTLLKMVKNKLMLKV
jgi:hypothetical protein